MLVGTCDDLSVHGRSGRFTTSPEACPRSWSRRSPRTPPHEIHRLLLEELALPPRPTVLLLEDMHWADEATLDVITLLVRRIASLPVLLLLTCRDGEAPPGHPVYTVLAATSAVLELQPLSAAAVASLSGEGADDVYATTGSNPFYVTELLASRSADELPRSITNAVRGRVLAALRRGAAARRARLGRAQSRHHVLRRGPAWPALAEEPERRALLAVDPRYVRFRHELARNAVRSSIPIAARRRLHAEILAALLSVDADPADIVHHAEAAGAENVVAEYALVAARRAAALDSNRGVLALSPRVRVRRAADRARACCRSRRARARGLCRLPARGCIQVDRTLDRRMDGAARRPRSVAVRRSCRGSTGTWPTATPRAKALEAIQILEPLGESSSSPAPIAASRS